MDVSWLFHFFVFIFFLYSAELSNDSLFYLISLQCYASTLCAIAYVWEMPSVYFSRFLRSLHIFTIFFFFFLFYSFFFSLFASHLFHMNFFHIVLMIACDLQFFPFLLLVLFVIFALVCFYNCSSILILFFYLFSSRFLLICFSDACEGMKKKRMKFYYENNKKHLRNFLWLWHIQVEIIGKKH